MKYSTTLAEIRKHDPCGSGWLKLLKGLGKSGADDEPLTLDRILEINGLDDALWALRSVAGIERQARLYACDCAQRVAHLNTDPRVQACIDTARRFANGEAAEQERAAAWDTAWAAARAAAWAAARAAAGAAAGAAAWPTARDAARDAARAAARDAAGAAAWDAAWAAAWDAAWDTERKIQTDLFIRHFCTEEKL